MYVAGSFFTGSIAARRSRQVHVCKKNAAGRQRCKSCSVLAACHDVQREPHARFFPINLVVQPELHQHVRRDQDVHDDEKPGAQLAKLHGQVEQEKAKAEVLEIQQHHAVEAARAEGLADAEKCVAFLQHIKKLDEGSDDGAQLVGGGKEAAKLGEELWHALRKNEALQAVSQGNAHVYFTPADANLSIEAKA